MVGSAPRKLNSGDSQMRLIGMGRNNSCMGTSDKDKINDFVRSM